MFESPETVAALEEIRSSAFVAEADRAEAKRLHDRFLRKLKKTWSEARRTAERDRGAAEELHSQVRAEAERLTADRERLHTEALDYQRQLDEAWKTVAQFQERLKTERLADEAARLSIEEHFKRREADLETRERELRIASGRSRQEVRELEEEIAALEARATAARAKIDSGDSSLPAPSAATNSLVTVPTLAEEARLAALPQLPIPAGRTPESFLAELAAKERELQRERLLLANARAEITRRAAELHDQKTALSERGHSVAVARHAWQQEEIATLAELETTTQLLVEREERLTLEEEQLSERHRRLDGKERDLRDLETRLELWQEELAARERAAVFERDKEDRAIDIKRGFLERWETTLECIQEEWTAAHESELDRLRNELIELRDDRAALAVRVRELEDLRERLLESAEKLAVRSNAIEACRLSLEESLGAEECERQLRVHAKLWQRYFSKVWKEQIAALKQQAEDSAREVKNADKKVRDGAKLQMEVSLRRAARQAARRAADRVDSRQAIIDDERAMILSLESIQNEPIPALRIAVVDDSEEMADIIPLQYAA